jgi:uncharacterized cupredoxin-like copper-binding protein
MTRVAALLATLVLAAVSLVACSSDGNAESSATATPSETMAPAEGGSTAVDATLTEFMIDLGESSAPAGTITITATNSGTVPHELVVARTDLAADALPIGDAGVDESALDVIGEIGEFPAGETLDGSFDLEPGHYVFFCNVPGHYQAGMRTEFTVS